MANRSTLHLSKLDEFAEWTESHHGYRRADTKGLYEALRLVPFGWRLAETHGRKYPPLIYHQRDGCDHASFPDSGPEGRLVRQWLRERTP